MITHIFEQSLGYAPLALPYIPLVFTAGIAVVCLLFIWSVRANLRAVREQVKALDERVNRAPIGGDEKAKPPAAIEPALIITNVAKAPLDTAIRSKILKLHRQGLSCEQIASSLRLPRGEVDLLVKVHQIELGSLGEAAPA